MRIGLIDVDGRHFPNLALMKLSAWYKAQGDTAEWWDGFAQYDRIYMSKVFDETYSPDLPEPCNGAEIVKGGTGYGLDNRLPGDVEHTCPDYSLYPALTKCGVKPPAFRHGDISHTLFLRIWRYRVALVSVE